MCLAIPGRIIDEYDSGSLRMGRVDFGGVVREACLEYVPEARIGDYTVIHVGFAISVLSEEEAQATLELLRSIEAAAVSSADDAAAGRAAADAEASTGDDAVPAGHGGHGDPPDRDDCSGP